MTKEVDAKLEEGLKVIASIKGHPQADQEDQTKVASSEQEFNRYRKVFQRLRARRERERECGTAVQ